jgi:hypothetical protein
VNINQEKRPWYAWLVENYTPIMAVSGIVMIAVGVTLLLGWGGFFMLVGALALLLAIVSQ